MAAPHPHVMFHGSPTFYSGVDGHEIVWENLKLTEISKIKLHLEDGKATAELE